LLSATLSGFNSTLLPATDDGSSAQITLPFAINYFGSRFDKLWVNNNGNLTFNSPQSTYTPFGLTGNIGTPIISPFFADVDTRAGGSGTVTYGAGTVDGHQAFGVTFQNVGYYAQHTDKLNAFQVLIIDRNDVGSSGAGDDFDIEFNYDQVQWETGDASGGLQGLGGTPAAAGFSNGTGAPNTYYQIQGSGVSGGLLDSNPSTGLVHSSINSAVPGRYIFNARNGTVIAPSVGGHSQADAADLGVAPGIHLQNRGISQAVGDDWYRFQLLRPDSIDVSLGFDALQGNLSCSLVDSNGIVFVPDSTSVSSGNLLLHYGINQPLGTGTYFLRITTVTGTQNAYSLSVDPSSASLTRVWYVNDNSRAGDLYALATGNNANSGLSPLLPKATLQSVLASPGITFNAHDLFHIDTGNYVGASASIDANAGGVIFAGSPVGTNIGFGLDLAGASNNTVIGFHFLGTGTGVYAHASGGAPSSNNVITQNYFGITLSTAVQLSGGTGNRVSNNLIVGKGGYGVYADVGGDLVVDHNSISGSGTSIYLNSSSASANSVTVDDNTLRNGSTGIYMGYSSANLQVFSNNLQGFTSYGMNLTTATNVSGNTVTQSGTGIYSGSASAVIAGNTLSSNTIGLKGYGRLGGVDWDTNAGNDIFNNGTGIVVANGTPGGGSAVTVQFNRIHGNAVGIDAQRSADINHNAIYRNTSIGVLISGATSATLANNTIYSPAGDGGSYSSSFNGVQIQANATNVTLKNNIIWVSAGYDLYVDRSSQQGFISDYNNFFKTGSASLVWWQKPFNDIFDWQSEAASDLHSIGSTVPDPTRDNPHFVNLAADNYHLGAAGLLLKI